MPTPPIAIHVGHSPDPDDAFMFYALAKDKIDTGSYRFTHEMADIETLNRRAETGELEVTAISIHAYPFVRERYALLSCGCSMGDGYGPMLVSRRPMSPAELPGRTIAVPGERTTAFLALNLCLRAADQTPRWHRPPAGDSTGGTPVPQVPPDALRRRTFDYRVMMFDAIPAAVAAGEVDAGLIIHEAQLTYARQGLHKVIDVAEWWLGETGLPLPLGGNVIRRDLGPAAMRDVARLLKASVEYGLAHRAEAVAYALQFGRDLDRDLTDRFIGMYVNKWTLDYGERGRAAVRTLLARAHVAGLVPDPGEIDFVGS